MANKILIDSKYVRIYVCYSKPEQLSIRGIKYIRQNGAGATFPLINEQTGVQEMVVWFNSNYVLDDETLVHELWHLYFDILDYVSNDDTFSPRELTKEVYAYDFSELYSNVKNALKKLMKGVENDKN